MFSLVEFFRSSSLGGRISGNPLLQGGEVRSMLYGNLVTRGSSMNIKRLVN